MKKFFGILIITLIFSAALYAQDVEKVKAKIEEMNKFLTQAMIDNDTEKMISLYADDIISLPSYQPMVEGIAKIRELSETQAKSGWKTTSFEVNTKDVMMAGNYVIEIGTYDMKMTGPDVPEWTDNGKYITIWEMQKDGSLKIKVETWNTDTNPWEQMQQNNEEDMEQEEK